MSRTTIAATLWISLLAAVAQAADSSARRAAEIIQASGVRGGLIVHVDCGDAALTAALRASDRYLVQGVDRDPDNVAKARRRLLAEGRYGPVSVDVFDGRRLPYADDLVNLLVAERLGDLPEAELLRVLAPEGVAYVGDRKLVKPRPAEIDDWSHFLHGPDNNAVARDTRVGPPRGLRWTCGPLWSRSHEFPSSLAAMVSAGGRLFYVIDEGPTSLTDDPMPERWTLVARDAFNGVLLWKRPLPEWRDAWRGSALRGGPAGVPRRLVAAEDRLYMTASTAGPLEVLDAATGTSERVVEKTEFTQEIALVGQTLLIQIMRPGQRRGTATGQIVALEAPGGRRLWQVDAPRYTGQSLAADGQRVVYDDGKGVVCLALDDGRRLWHAAEVDGTAGKPARGGKTVLLHGDLVLESAGGITARSAADGQILWRAAGGGHSMQSTDLFVAQGAVWHSVDDGIAGYDLKTGQPARHIDPSCVQTPGHHLRCYRAKATEDYLITQFRGAEFVSLTDAPHAENDWVRGSCRFGLVPANGLLYAPPHPCFCFPGVKLTGLNALSGKAESGKPKAEEERLHRGPAYNPDLHPSSLILHPSEEWPTYRHDARRTGSTTADVAPSAPLLWEAKLGGRLTPPVMAGGRVFVAAKDRHTLYALDALQGTNLWSFTAGGPIDSPPSVYGPLVLFGCADGRVYCLQAEDGQLAWRFDAAPADRRIVAFNQLESPWRVHGNVLIHDGMLYCTAGRSTYLDGGIRLLKLDPITGRLVAETVLDTTSNTRDDVDGKPFIVGYHMEGALSDILVAQQGSIYLGQMKFDADLVQQPAPYVLNDPQRPVVAMDLANEPYVSGSQKDEDQYEKHQRDWVDRTQPELVARYNATYGGYNFGHRRLGLHVFSTAGFLDDTWFNRTFWMYSQSWPGFYIAHRAAKTGQLLVVGPERTYAVQAFPLRNLQSPLFKPASRGYLLVADDNDNEPVLDDRTRGTTKGWGFTRSKPPAWHQWVPVRIRAMTLAGQRLFFAGPPDVLVEGDPTASLEGRDGALLWSVSPTDGARLAGQKLDAPPVFDGLIAAVGRLYMSTVDGRLVCFGGR